MNQFLKYKTKWLIRILLILTGLFVFQNSIATVSVSVVNIGVNNHATNASFAESLAMGVKGAVMGSFIGGISGGIQGFRQAKILNQNGWNGKQLGVKGPPSNFLNSSKRTVSVQKQARHLSGTAGNGKEFLNSIDDANAVLDAVHSGEATFLGTSKAGHQVFRYNGVTGTNVNLGAGISRQPTNVFMIKGTASPSVVPTSPFWTP